ncbi:hypothetical protein N7471_010640 [Penicillium samsonianum]|uniref:uncharacterized protein n=1 Tax=Penicillium samsonianum TaxID=1882272 RepID=UPI0025481AF2|nr:uncharacterized protein N7471_010640 [Penicillium samsonianum]KAJ6126147.1 hypothetical protein N7471_010640 [Penicillium samsonianum]
MDTTFSGQYEDDGSPNTVLDLLTEPIFHLSEFETIDLLMVPSSTGGAAPLKESHSKPFHRRIALTTPQMQI